MSAGARGFRSTETVAASVVERWKSGFIANPAYDAVFFIFAPLLGLGLAFLVTRPVGRGQAIFIDPRLAYCSSVWTYAHLCAVVFRSHLNTAIFAQHRGRFIAVPLLVYAGLVSSQWIFAIGFVLIVFWDVYHTSAQNFGFCRIYDSKQGNSPEQGRALDFWLNHFIYIGPVLGGINLMPHLTTLGEFRLVGVDLSGVVTKIRDAQPVITETVVIAGLVYLAFYLYSYWQISRQGYRVSPQKIFLLVSTAVASIWAWSWLPPVQAFFVANFFHALQYFAIVWWIEKKNIVGVFGLARLSFGRQMALLGFIAVVAVMGIGYRTAINKGVYWASLTIVISMMHFWYDGFVWSVRRHEVG